MKSDKWEVVANEDGSFDLLRQGQVLHRSIPNRWLEAELGKYGFCGKEYRDIRLELQDRGRAVMVVPKTSPLPSSSDLRKGGRSN